MIRKECNKFSDICDSMSDWYKPLAWVLLFFGSAACTEGPIVPEPEPEPSGFTIHMDEENIVEYQEDEQGIYPHLYTAYLVMENLPADEKILYMGGCYSNGSTEPDLSDYTLIYDYSEHDTFQQWDWESGPLIWNCLALYHLMPGTTYHIRGYVKTDKAEYFSNTMEVRSNFTAPMEETTDAYTIPVIFHLIQSNKDIASYGGEIPMERIHLLLDKINNTFSGSVSTNATGVDTKIRFKAAVYDPYGNKLQESGINRIYVDEVIDEAKDKYNTFIVNQKALWPYDKYLNVWLISDRENKYNNFFYTISRTCIPRYITPGTDPTEIPKGLTLSSVPENWTPTPNEVGILYKLQSIQTMVRSFGEKNENELVNGFGFYLGLLPTWGASSRAKPQDYCSDTHKYYGNDNEGYNKNQTAYKLVGDCFFLAENIMDDPVGVHRSVSQQQAQRMRWILTNSPERSAWKSDYAFTGR